MRTRIALVAAVPVTLTAVITALQAPAGAASGTRPTTDHPSRLASLRSLVLEGDLRSGNILSYRAVPTAGLGTTSSPGTSTPPGTIALADLTSPLSAMTTATAATTAVTTAATTPAPAPAPPPPTDATSTDTADWACIRVHESGDRYNSANAPSGAYGIIQVTWHSFGYGGWPYEASSATQDALALRLYNEYGWQPWSTRFVCGL